MRIKPLELDIPETDPFLNDLLDRREPASILTDLVSSFEGPCVLAVDGEWGSGKTTFLKIWTQHLRNKDFAVIQFNAWETDFSENPFVALSTELTDNIGEYATDQSLGQKLVDSFTKAIQHIAPLSIKIVSQILTTRALDLDLSGMFSDGSNPKTPYHAAKKSMEEFKASLKEVAIEIAKSKEDKPFIVAIDELDRCRPSYAIELLEIIKHLFMIDGIVFVLAINRSELAHSIQAIYGNNFNANGYLRRFIDIDFRLPNPDRNNFIDALTANAGFADYLATTKDPEAGGEFHASRNLLKRFFSTSDISFRMIEQAIYRLGLLFRSLANDKKSFMPGAIIASILRTIEPDLYHQFIHKDVEDDTLISDLFSGPRGKLIEPLDKNDFISEVSYLIATIILATLSQDTDGSNPTPYYSRESPLLSQCREVIEAEKTGVPHLSTPGAIIDNSNALIAHEIVRIVENRLNNLSGIVDFGFWHSVKRLELISPELLKRS